MKSYIDITKDLLSFINNSPSCFHVINSVEKILKDFTPLKENEIWNLVPGHSYYVTRNDSSLIAFKVPLNNCISYRISAAHSDCPSFKLKYNYTQKDNNYIRLNVEGYGGMLLSPWFDRPLSVAGRIVLNENDKIITKRVAVDKDLLIIPSLAIHMNREANNGIKYNIQTDLLPIAGEADGKHEFLDIVGKAIGVSRQQIIDYDLYLYNRMPGTIWGLDEEFVSSRALDDLMCVYGITKGFAASEDILGTLNMCCIFDNEEVGSTTRQGANSTFLEDTLLRINSALGRSLQEHLASIANGFMVSADNAHALHPAHTEKADLSNCPYMNKGVVIKYNAAQKYTTDAISAAIFRKVCDTASVPYQVYANRSDIAGGSTLGNISISHVSLHSVDIGLAQLAMHSPYETAGAKDTKYLIDAIKAYYSTDKLI